jgi:hypothetical protein
MRSITTCILVSAMAVACGDLPQPIVQGNTGGDAESQVKSLKPEAPQLTTHISTSYYSSLPLRGKAEKETNVIVDGGAAPTAIDVSALGTFCVDVALAEGSNTLRIYAQREDGSRSDTVKYSVKYDPNDPAGQEETPPPPQTGSVRNIALHRTAEASISTTAAASMTDDDDGTYSTFTDWYAVAIDLGQAYDVQKIEVVWAASGATDGYYGNYYDVLGSLQASPSRPMDNTTTGWSALGSVSDGDGGSDSFEFGTPISARWIGLNVTYNATGWYNPDRTTELAEIRVFAPQVINDGSTGHVGPPTCDNGD